MCVFVEVCVLWKCDNLDLGLYKTMHRIKWNNFVGVNFIDFSFSMFLHFFVVVLCKKLENKQYDSTLKVVINEH